VRLDWKPGTLRFEFIPHDLYPDQPEVIEVRGLHRAEFPRGFDWGPSNSVLEAKEPEPLEDGSRRFVVAMQSGDDLVVVADEFILDPR
jgi:hypothetical protein